jgi:uncharacterized membrane protein
MAIAYAATLTVFAVVDLIWLAVVAKGFYRAEIGHLLADKFNLPAAVVFYLLYVAGLLIFAVLPALESGRAIDALKIGALFGLFAYATYDLTNLATLKDWSLKLTLVDMAWGSFLSGLSAYAGCLIARSLS